MRLLVVGGAGYIGSHMVLSLLEAGHDVTVLDDLSYGHRDAVPMDCLVVGNIADAALLDRILSTDNYDGVMHFAAFIQVGESVLEPAKYYRNNFVNTQILLDAMVHHGIDNFIFSSTAAIFGEPQYIPIDEAHPLVPISPYGRSKLMVEQMLEDYEHAYGLRSICLRYFNAAGANPEGKLGERHEPETHLIPLVLQAASGRCQAITVYGTNYDTPDGTCIRDYIHVSDLCDAHLLAMARLVGGGASARYNLGNGNGFSVQEVIETARAVTGRDIPVVYGERRGGDAARLVADSHRIVAELGWRPRYAALKDMVAHAWRWECRV